jgi:hypothetical protein
MKKFISVRLQVLIVIKGSLKSRVVVVYSEAMLGEGQRTGAAEVQSTPPGPLPHFRQLEFSCTGCSTSFIEHICRLNMMFSCHTSSSVVRSYATKAVAL